MGMSISTGLYYGIRLDQEKKCGIVTKYNEDTGEPYEKEIEVIQYSIFGTDQEVPKINERYYISEHMDDFDTVYNGCWFANDTQDASIEAIGILIMGEYGIGSVWHEGLGTLNHLAEPLAMAQIKFERQMEQHFQGSVLEAIKKNAELFIATTALS